MKSLFERVIVGPWTTAGDDAHYRLEQDGDVGYLFLSCTWDKHGWWHNFDFAVAPYRDMTIPWMAHKGFVELWKSESDEIAAKVAAMPIKTLIIAGYSQGGALAVLAHEDMKWRFPVLEVFTHAYAAPRVLWMPDRIIKARFDRLTRWTVRGDIVTMVPPVPYWHVGIERLVGPMAAPWWTHHRPEEYLRSLP